MSLLEVSDPRGAAPFMVSYGPKRPPIAGHRRPSAPEERYEVRLDGRPIDPSTARLLAASLIAIADEVDRFHAPRRRS